MKWITDRLPVINIILSVAMLIVYGVGGNHLAGKSQRGREPSPGRHDRGES